MSVRTRIVVVTALTLVIAAAVGGVLLRHKPKATGTLSAQDVDDICAVVVHAKSPQRSSFTTANVRNWPALALTKLTFRIVDLKEASTESRPIRGDGTPESSTHPVTVCYTSSGSMKRTCRLERIAGQWTIVPDIPASRLLLFVPPNPRSALDAPTELCFNFEARWPAAGESEG